VDLILDWQNLRNRVLTELVRIIFPNPSSLSHTLLFRTQDQPKSKQLIDLRPKAYTKAWEESPRILNR